MSVLTTPQEPSWDSNVYVLATTRVFVLMGTAYLVRSLYNLVSPASTVAATVSGLGLEEINADNLATGLGATGTGPDLEANLNLDIQLPQHTFDPQHQAQRPQASLRADDHPVGPPMPSVATDAISEQDIGDCSDDAHFEEGSEISVDLVN